MTDACGTSFGPTDVAFIEDRLYVLIEMGGCPRGMPDNLPAILRADADRCTSVGIAGRTRKIPAKFQRNGGLQRVAG
jgi:hypothetical protein